MSPTVVRIVVPATVLGVLLIGGTVRPVEPETTGEGRTAELSLDEAQTLASEVESHFRQGRVGDSVRQLEQLHQAYPNNDIYLWRLAQAYREDGRAAEAAVMLEAYMDRSPVAWEACPAIGDDYWAAGQPAAALDSYRRCLALEPYNPDHVLALGLAHERLGHADEASKLFAQGAEMVPAYLDFRIALGRLQIKAGEPETAEVTLRRILAEDPDHSDAWFALGLALERQGRIDESAQAYGQRGATADNVDITVGLARTTLWRGDAAQAERLASEIVTTNPSNVDAMLVLTMALEQLARLDDARQWGERILAITPEYPDVHLVMGRIAEAQGERAEALRWYDRVLELQPGRDDAEAAKRRLSQATGGAL